MAPIAGCICGRDATGSKHILTCTICGTKQHFACIIAEDMYSETASIRATYACDCCNPGLRHMLNHRLESGREACVEAITMVIEPYVWFAYCRIPAQKQTPNKVLERTLLEYDGVPKHNPPGTFIDGWKQGLSRLLGLLDAVEVSKLEGVLSHVASTPFAWEWMLWWLLSIAQTLVASQAMHVRDLGVFAEVLGLGNKGVYWDGQ